MTEHYQKAIDWLKDREAEALLTSDLLQRFPEAAEHELPATIEWIIQQIEQAHENWLRTSTDTEAMLKVCDDVGFGFTLVPEEAKQGRANWLRTSTGTAAMLEARDDVAGWLDKPEDKRIARRQPTGIAAQMTAGEREKIGPDALQRMADVFNGPEEER